MVWWYYEVQGKQQEEPVVQYSLPHSINPQPYVLTLLLPIAQYYTSIKIIKNEVGCRDDTMPKTVDTRRHCEEE